MYEEKIRLGTFIGIILIIGVWELISPKRKPGSKKTARWFSNISITLINTSILRFGVPITAFYAATIAQENGWGLLNLFNLPFAFKVLVSVILFDFAIYLQHLVFHKIPVLWRLHRMHHADIDFDLTTGFRFHPFEIILSTGIKMGLIVAIGPPILAILVFELVLSTVSIFNHGNISIPAGLDRVMRWLIVTPDMHRIHHSVINQETNSNFGFNLPWWDRLFGTYKERSKENQETMKIGLEEFREPKYLNFKWVLAIPFIKT